MWKLSAWYGTGLVLVLCGILKTLISDSASYNTNDCHHDLAYLLGILLNMNCIVLLCGLGYSSCKDDDDQLLASLSNGGSRGELSNHLKDSTHASLVQSTLDQTDDTTTTMSYGMSVTPKNKETLGEPNNHIEMVIVGNAPLDERQGRSDMAEKN